MVVSPLDEIPGIWNLQATKKTLEIADGVQRKVKALPSLKRQKMKDLVTSTTKREATKKMDACFIEADKVMASAPHGPIAREHLTKGRNRLNKA